VIVTLAHREGRPFLPGEPVDTGSYGEYDLMQTIGRGGAPYRIWTPEVAPGLFWFCFIRKDRVAE